MAVEVNSSNRTEASPQVCRYSRSGGCCGRLVQMLVLARKWQIFGIRNSEGQFDGLRWKGYSDVALHQFDDETRSNAQVHSSPHVNDFGGLLNP